MAHKALIVGGVDAVVRKTVAPFLALYDIEVAHVWPIDGGKNILRSELPADIDTCILLVDMAPRESVVPTLKAMCSKRRVVLVSSPRKQAHMDRALSLAGFYRTQKQRPELVELDADEVVEVVPPPVPAPVPVRAKEETVAKPVSVPTPVPGPAPESFESCMAQLKGVLKTLRDQHGVDEVLYSRSSGLEITRRQVISADVD